MKMTNHIGLCDTELAWYSLNATHRICLYSLKNSIGIHSFKPTWHCLLVKNFATRVKSLNHLVTVQRSTTPWSFTEHIFGCFHSAVAQLELIKHKFPNSTTLHVYLCGFQIADGVKQCTTYQCTNYYNATNHVRCLSWFELHQSRDIRATNKHLLK